MNHYTPRLTLKQRLQHHKYAKLERELKPLCSWVDFYDYLWSYGSINWKGKVVLDIGADIGSSAIFFLMNGAKAVYLIENNDEYITTYFDKIVNTHSNIYQNHFKKLPTIWNITIPTIRMDEECNTSASILNAIKKYPIYIEGVPLDKIDVLKMDCEGCELQLLTEELLNKANEFVVGLHKPQLDDYEFEQKKKLLEKHGGKYFGNVNNEEFVWIRKA